MPDETQRWTIEGYLYDPTLDSAEVFIKTVDGLSWSFRDLPLEAASFKTDKHHWVRVTVEVIEGPNAC